MSSPSSTGNPGAGRQPNVTAFLSAKEGAGCTSTLANLAWALSAAGRRVLVVDWSPAGTGQREFLGPFASEQVELPGPLARQLRLAAALPANPAEAGPLTAVRCTHLDQAGYVDVVTLNAADFATTAAPGLREQLLAAGYDDVLVDCPAGPGDPMLAFLGVWCRCVVVCFVTRAKEVAEARALVDRVRLAGRPGLAVLPLATRFGDRFPERAKQARSLIAVEFGSVVEEQAEVLHLAEIPEIPERSHDTVDPVLNLVVEEPGAGGRLEAGYGNLMAALTGGAPASVPEVPELVRRRYRKAFGLPVTDGGAEDRVVVVYATPDRAWADWVDTHLRRAGASTRFFRDAEPWLSGSGRLGVVLVGTAAFDEAGLAPEVVAQVGRARRTGTRVDVVILAPGGSGRTSDMFSDAVTISGDFAQDGQWLVTRMLRHFGFVERPGSRPAEGGHLPGRARKLQSLPPRRPVFVGRDDEVEGLRDRLPVARAGREELTGRPGIGKTELALEFAHRFAGDYDVVWWIPAADRQSVLLALADLAERLAGPASGTYGNTVALDRLRDPAFQRFLLIYDNVEDRAVLEGTVPESPQGHVIVTGSAAPASAIELAELSSRDGVRLLNSRVNGLTFADAQEVAEAVRHLPLALDLAGAWLNELSDADRRAGSSVLAAAAWAARRFLDRLGSPAGRAGEDSDATVARVVGLILARLDESPLGRCTALLARLCCCYSPHGIGLGLIRSTAMIDRLAELAGPDANLLRQDAVEIDRMLWLGSRLGLFRVSWAKPSSLQVHRVVQQGIRRCLGAEEEARYRAEALRVLVRYAPSEVEVDERFAADRFLELHKHVFPSGAVLSEDAAVRRWLAGQVRFYYRSGGPQVQREALPYAERVLREWTARFGEDDPLRMRMALQVANLHRALGDSAAALDLDDAVLGSLRRQRGLTHPQTLFAARARGGDLRSLGDFAEGLVEDLSTWDGLREALGDDHPETQMAASNAAGSLFLNGDLRRAHTVATEQFERRKRLYGNSLEVWAALVRVGAYRRELGRHRDAVHALREALGRLADLEPKLNVYELIALRQLAVAERTGPGAGTPGHAEDACSQMEEAYTGYRTLLGDDHPATMGCALSRAATLRATGTDLTGAVELAEVALHGLRTKARYAEQHPFTALARLTLGSALLSAGELDRGRDEVTGAHEVLVSRLQAAHPWSLAAAVARAWALAACGQGEEAARRITEVRLACLEHLGEDHPLTAVAAHDEELAAAGQVRCWRVHDVDIPHI
ncbi:FxSxx-COOH system tetratricopeptide repeat protein [Amycolatopsis sp. NPDC024027]|uniref:FxSxx-COOH system tetratricopeptide repeat protein n=1 Tax=Amycolatopsis sp. NPDC024027 TaxID=3154327 RepID=UPI0033DABB4C